MVVLVEDGGSRLSASRRQKQVAIHGGACAVIELELLYDMSVVLRVGHDRRLRREDRGKRPKEARQGRA
jgi:hypothetical protein